MLKRIPISAAWIAVSLAECLAASPKDKDKADKNSLERQLQSQLRFTLTRTSSDMVMVTAPGTVLVLQRPDLKAGPLKTPTYFQNTWKDGRFRESVGNALLHNKNELRPFAPGDPFYLLRIEAKDNGIQFYLLSARSADGMLYKAVVLWPFPKGFLAAPDFNQMQAGIFDVFSVEGGAAPLPPPPGPPVQTAETAPPPPPPPAPAAEPVTILLGMTADQVVAALGRPTTSAKLGDKEIYVYRDLKITFLNGKVSDVQ